MLYATEALSKSSFKKAINTLSYKLGWTATVLCVTSNFIPTGEVRGAFQMYAKKQYMPVSTVYAGEC